MAVEGQQPVAPTMKFGGTVGQFKFVKLSAANTVIECAATTDKPFGVSQESGVSGGAGKVCCIGVTKLEGDADLSVGNSIGTSSDAQAAAYTAADTTKYIVGQVMDDNSAAGGLITAAIDCLNARTLA